jgi:hypothetical protein
MGFTKKFNKISHGSVIVYTNNWMMMVKKKNSGKYHGGLVGFTWAINAPGTVGFSKFYVNFIGFSLNISKVKDD